MYTALTHRTSTNDIVNESRTGSRARGPKRLRRRGALTAIMTALALATIPAVATAQPLNGVAIHTSSSWDFLVLDVSGGSTANGAPVIQWYSNGNSNQRWNFVPDNNGYEHIVNENSGKCLATNGAAGNWVTQWPCSDSTQEDWKTTLNPYGGTPETIEYRDTNMYMDINGNSSSAGAQLIVWWADSWAVLFNYGQY